jgi:hypothetical protein
MGATKASKTKTLPYNRPEELILARVLLQALEDVDHLPYISSDTEFRKQRNDLWSFFNGDWFHEILWSLGISVNNPVWEETRQKIWRCVGHRVYIRPDRRKDGQAEKFIHVGQFETV